MEFSFKEIIEEVDKYWLPDIKDKDGNVDEKEKERTVFSIEDDLGTGDMEPLRGLLILSLIDGLDPKTIPADIIESQFGYYPQYKTVERALERRAENVPDQCLLDSFVVADFIESYCKRSISFEELLLRLLMLGRVPQADYLRMTPAQRRKLGTDVELYDLW